MPAVTKRENTRKKGILSQLGACQCVLYVGRQGFWNTGVPGGRNIIQRCLGIDTFSSKEKMVQEPDKSDI